MFYGKTIVVRAALLAAALGPALLPALPARAQKAVPAARPHGKLQPVTVRSIDDQAAHLTLADGAALDALVRPSSLFLKDGRSVPPSAFAVGTRALLDIAHPRQRRGRLSHPALRPRLRRCAGRFPQEDAGRHGAEHGR